MANHRQRASRAKARATARNLETGVSLTESVNCAHGPGLRHTVQLDVSHEGVITHLSSECTRRRPSEEEVAVTRGLLQKDMYACCSWVVAEIADRVQLAYQRERNTYAPRSLSMQPRETVLPPLLSAATNELAANATVTQKKRAGNPGLFGGQHTTVMKLTGRNAVESALLRDVVAPNRWRVGIVHTAFLHDEELAVDATEETASKNKRRTCVQVVIDLEYGVGPKSAVATYRGHGRFQVHDEAVRQLQSRHRMVPSNPDGKFPCNECGIAVSNLNQHLKSKRHFAKVETAVFNICEQIGARLQHKAKR